MEIDNPTRATILAKIGAEVTQTSLVISTLPAYEDAEELLAFLGQIDDSIDWWVGDALNQMEYIYGDKMYQAASLLRRSEQTAMNKMSVCRRIPRSRRRQNLSFSHHAEVAYLEPEEQTRWLSEAETNGWSRNHLRAEIRAVRNGESDVLPPAVDEHVGEVCPTCKRPYEFAASGGASTPAPSPFGGTSSSWRSDDDEAATVVPIESLLTGDDIEIANTDDDW